MQTTTEIKHSPNLPTDKPTLTTLAWTLTPIAYA